MAKKQLVRFDYLLKMMISHAELHKWWDVAASLNSALIAIRRLKPKIRRKEAGNEDRDKSLL